jgi:hypothetical protein
MVWINGRSGGEVGADHGTGFLQGQGKRCSGLLDLAISPMRDYFD